MKFGAHVSVAGGLQNGPVNAAKIGAEVFQFFSRSPQGGPAPLITPEIQDAFLEKTESLGLSEWVIHAPYYINFASGEGRTRGNSIRIIREELERGTQLQAKYVMFHPGSAKDLGREAGLKTVIEGLKKVLDGYKGTTRLLIEISAGAGDIIGDTFEEIAILLAGIDHPEVGVCFDTAHAFASGYDLRTKKSVYETFETFDKLIGLSRLKMSHCNDSKVDIGAKKDRHEHLGEGFIGKEGFVALVQHPKLAHINLYLETEPGPIQEEELVFLKKTRLS